MICKSLTRLGFKLRSAIPARWIYFAALFLVIAFGVELRAWLYISAPALWLDETSWAIKLVSQPLQALYVRPIGFMWASLQVVQSFGFSELTLRAIPFLASCATLPVAWLILREMLTSRWLQLLGVLAFSIHPWFIDYGTEFKPYALELFLHLLFAWCCLREQRQPRSLLVLAAVAGGAALSFLLAYNLIFLYPAFFGVHVLATLRRKRHLELSPVRLRMTILGAAALSAAGLILWIRQTALSVVVQQDESPYWANKYGVFFGDSERAGTTRVDWLVTKYLGFTEAPAQLREWGWNHLGIGAEASGEFTTLLNLAWLLLHFWGIRALLRRGRLSWLVLLLSPTLVAVLFNFIGKWPFGVFRTNLFLLGYFVILGFVGLDSLRSERNPMLRRLALLLAFALVLPASWIAAGGRREKAWGTANMRDGLALIARLSARPDFIGHQVPIYCDSYSCWDLDAYINYHTGFMARYHEMFRNAYRIRRGSRVRDITANLKRQATGPALIFLSRTSEFDEARRKLPALCSSLTFYDQLQSPLVAVCVRGRPPG